MSIIKAKSKWAEVQVPFEKLGTDEAFQFLSNIEELTEYQLNTAAEFADIAEISTKKRAKRKREKDDDRIDDQRPRKKKKRKMTSLTTNDVKDSEDIDSNKSVAEKSTIAVENVKHRRDIVESDAPEPSDLDLNDKNLENSTGNVENVTNDEDIVQSDAPSDLDLDINLSAWNEFGLAEPILKALRDLKFSQPTPIQKLCLPPALRDHLDILGAAETGSGKTLAFAIPIVQSILEKAERSETTLFYPKALILTPTRELAIQIKDHIAALLKYTRLKVSAIIGGLSVQKQERLLKKRPEILVATPGRLWAMIEGEPEYFKNLPKIEFLVIDETDRMVEKGHFQELSLILEHLTLGDSNHKRQTFVFSATLAFVHPPPKRLVSKSEVRQMTPKQKIEMLVALTRLREERKVIDITKNFGTAESLVEARIICGTLDEKDTYLYYFLTNYPGRTLIFANSINCTRRLKNLLVRLRFAPLVLNAQMHQKQRLKNLEKFSVEDLSVLLATDVAARGLDIKNINHVIHYQVPRTAEIYVHRSGRTARASTEGLSVMLVDGQDALNYRKICQTLNKDQDLPIFPVSNKQLTFLRERIRLASELESLEHTVAHTAANQNWFRKAAKGADLDFDDKRGGSDSEDERTESLGQRRKIKALSKRLNALLQQPLPKETMFTTKYPTSVADIYEKLALENAASSASALDTAKKESIAAATMSKGKEKFIRNLKMKKIEKKHRKVKKFKKSKRK